MAFKGKLTPRSRTRVCRVYAMLCAVLIPVVYLTYSFLSHITFMHYTFKRRIVTYALFLTYAPLSGTIILLLSGICLAICYWSINTLLCPLLRFCREKLKNHLPWRIRRRTWCFCNCSCKRLHKILRDIHSTHCNWEPQRPDNLDDTTRRYITLVLDGSRKRLECPNMDYRLVGSSAEGLGKPYTIELRRGYSERLGTFLVRFFCCCCPCRTSYTSLRTDYDIILECSDTQSSIASEFSLDEGHCGKSGFTRLSYKPGSVENPWTTVCQEVAGRQYLSASLVRHTVFDVVNSSSESDLPASTVFGMLKHPPVIELEEKGPAVKLATYPLGQAWYWNDDQRIVTFEGDFVFGIHCFRPWPACTADWTTRARLWPPPKDVKQIADSGFILVPKSSHQTSKTDDDVEWHVSFPHCETYISEKMPKVAKACYLALKLVLKNHLVYHCEDLKTYHLKTTLLWELEKHQEAFWALDNINECFMSLLDNFTKYVQDQRCPNYWIESLDLFAELNRKELTALSAVLLNIRSNPAPYIEDVGSMWC